MLEAKLLEELKIIIQEDYGIELKQEYVEELATALVSYGELLTRVWFEQSFSTEQSQNETK